MFKKVRLQLTLINIAVVGVILILFLSGIYILMKQDTERQSVQRLRAIGSDIRMRSQHPDSLPPVRLWGNYFYVSYDSEGTLLSMSADIPLAQDELNTLLNEAFQDKQDIGVINTKSGSFRFLRSYPPDLHEMTFIFLSTLQEREILARLGTTLILVGFAGILLVFVSSLFLAGRALIPIKKSWERQQNFVADASHELRSPLAVIQTNLELVLGNSEETVDSQSKWLENIQTENRRMTKLVGDLLFLARADTNQQTIERSIFPLHKVVQEAVASLEPIAAKKCIKLSLNLNTEIEFLGDEGRLKQLTVILLDNAIKYTSNGGTAELKLNQHDNQVELSVTDNGDGIPSEHLSKIFDRFYRVDKARSRDSEGTGLGLSIAAWIVKEHKGTISVTSTLGSGSTFKVLLPIMLQKG